MATYSPTGSGGIHYDQILTNISLGYEQVGEFIAEQLVKVVPVKKQTDKYYVFGRESWIPSGTDYRAPGTVANEIGGIQVSTDTYYAQEHALQIVVTDEERENADSAFSPDRDATELVTAKILLNRELAVRNFVTDTSRYAPSLVKTLTATTQWDVYATSDPVQDFRLAKFAVHNTSFVDPNVAVIPYQVMFFLLDHPKIIDRIKYTDRAILTEELVASVLGLTNVVVPGMPVGTSAGTSNNFNMTATYLWGDDVLLAYVPKKAGLKTPAFAYEFAWTYGGKVMLTDRWREEVRKSDLIRVSRRYDHKMIGVGTNPADAATYNKSIVAFLLKDVLSPAAGV